MVLDLSYSHTEDRSNIAVYEYTGNKNQKWNIEEIPTNTLSSGKYQIATIRDFSKIAQARTFENKAPVDFAFNQNQPNQIWYFQYQDTSRDYTIQTLNPDKIQVMKRDLTNNKVYIDQHESTQDSHWTIEERKDGNYVLRSSNNTDLALDGGSEDVGSEIMMNKSLVDSQIWRLHQVDKPPLPDGNYIISTKLNYKKIIDANETDISIFDYSFIFNEGWILQYDKNKNAYKIYTEAYQNKGLVYQKLGGNIGVDNIDGPIDAANENRRYWTIEYNEIKGGYYIWSLYSPLEAVNLPNGDTTNNTKINTFPISNLENQLWNLAPKKPN